MAANLNLKTAKRVSPVAASSVPALGGLVPGGVSRVPPHALPPSIPIQHPVQNNSIWGALNQRVQKYKVI